MQCLKKKKNCDAIIIKTKRIIYKMFYYNEMHSLSNVLSLFFYKYTTTHLKKDIGGYDCNFSKKKNKKLFMFFSRIPLIAQNNIFYFPKHRTILRLADKVPQVTQ